MIAVVHTPVYCRVVRATGSFCVSYPFDSTEGQSNWKLLTNDSCGLKGMCDMLQTISAQPWVKNVSQVNPSNTLNLRQRQVLQAAMKRGYFEFPRMIDLTQLANELSIKPSTLEEILRRAEQKMLGPEGCHR